MRLSFFLILLALFAPHALADNAPRLAVIPYLTLNLSSEEERELREVLALEIASNTTAKVISNKEVQKKLPPIPDGCPENPDCVNSVGTPLGADYLLFVALIKDGDKIDMQLFLVEVAGTGAMRQEKSTLTDESTWSDSMGTAVHSLLGGVKRLAKETALTPTQPTTKIVVVQPTPPNKKIWPWLAIGGGVLLAGAAAGAFVTLYPFTTLGSFGPGAAQ